MRYLVVVTRNNPYEPSYVIHELSYDELSKAIDVARLNAGLFPDDLVTIEVEGWRT